MESRGMKQSCCSKVENSKLYTSVAEVGAAPSSASTKHEARTGRSVCSSCRALSHQVCSRWSRSGRSQTAHEGAFKSLPLMELPTAGCACSCSKPSPAAGCGSAGCSRRDMAMVPTASTGAQLVGLTATARGCTSAECISTTSAASVTATRRSRAQNARYAARGRYSSAQSASSAYSTGQYVLAAKMCLNSDQHSRVSGGSREPMRSSSAAWRSTPACVPPAAPASASSGLSTGESAATPPATPITQRAEMRSLVFFSHG
mmetsp:Transcript_59394/g.136182  ORF Transcript_59394/g.136182 Transcript_59394/m.136182 type:complete len:260 (-) Transcript_59394:516-1295(-)